MLRQNPHWCVVLTQPSWNMTNFMSEFQIVLWYKIYRWFGQWQEILSVTVVNTACHTTVGSHCHLVTVCVISHHRSSYDRIVFVQQSSVFVWQWLSCTVILSRVQTRQVQGHHAAGIVSGDLYVSLDTLSIDGATSIIRYNPHPLHCFPRRLPGPVHVVASKSKPRSFTGETETFTRLLQHCTGGNGLQALTFHPWWIQRGRKLSNQFSNTNLTLTVYTGE